MHDHLGRVYERFDKLNDAFDNSAPDLLAQILAFPERDLLFLLTPHVRNLEDIIPVVTFPPDPIPACIFGSAGIQEDRTWPGSVIRLKRS